MRIRFLQHVPFEGPGLIGSWAKRRGHRLEGTRLDLGEPLPSTPEFDMLVVMGGPMSVNDERDHAWLAGEKRLVADAIQEAKIVVGVCLGAQLIASASGARVYPGTKEIGWFPVRQCRPAAERGPLSGLPEVFAALHWHGETFDLPRGAARLAETDACPNQAFELGPRVLGMQFHLEIDVDGIRGLLREAAGDLTGGSFQQSAEQIVEKTCELSGAASRLLDSVLDAVSAG